MDQSIASPTIADLAAVPPAPAIDGNWENWPVLLIDDKHLSIGWEDRPERKGGRCYLVGRASATGGTKVLRRFPASEFGWEETWHFLVARDPALVPKLRKELEDRAATQRRRTEVDQIDALDQVAVKSVMLLGGHLTGMDMPAGKRYDLRFLTDRLLVTGARDFEPLIDTPYADVQEVEISGQGPAGIFSRGLAPDLVREAVALPDSRIQTILRIHMAAGELFFLDSRTLPDALRIQLSRPLAAIRKGGGAAARAAATIGELRALASMLESGLLTRQEFDTLKSGLLAGQGE